ncbi:iron-siderophore ABC transporter substrate-binding protein [Pseudonocardia cypriaca]|uniref:Iron complex transport system substrate-binding protein n=1 Tax=Pseudonocardia cypriaca TaxID=882449 RepID=A0A543GCJ1_9PSEU|nr:iron-siderophore ABC transporter substrate-binding protein [Pseudonocardia cypriaca]TQM43786.1 iron complex transport system substrate-binding protein [Pseudonocardia cypriaca]
MKPRWLSLVAGLSALFLLAACGGGSATAPSTSSQQPDADAAFPVTVVTKFGDVTVDAPPTRVVAMGWGDAETALALGVQPVGAADWLDFGGEGVGPWAAGRYTAPPEIIGTLEPSYEQVAALRPDLILDTKSSGDEQRYDLLSRIAPTIALPPGAENYKTTLTDQVTMVAAALGVPERGAELIADVEGRFAAAAAAHPEFAGRTVTVAARSGTGWGAYASSTERVEFMTRLGFVPNPRIESLPEVRFSHPVSEEQLSVLDADLLVVFPIQRTAAEVNATPLFAAIPAVRAGRVIVFDDPDVQKAYSTNSVLSIQFALDAVVPLIAERLSSE